MIVILLGNVQCCLFEKVGFIQQQVDDNNGDKCCCGILDDILYYWNIVKVDYVVGQCQFGVNCCVLVDIEFFGLLDDQYQCKQKNCFCQKYCLFCYICFYECV